MTDSPPTPELASMLSELEVTDNALEKYREIFINELKKGCNNDTEKESSLKCLVTYVHDLPDENVKGKFLALDLGGTNFRVLCVKIARTYLDVKAKKYGVSEEVMRGSGEQLFDHIAECLYQFTTEHKINQDNLPLGFTFSFPCEQRGLEVGILTQWTKGFSCPGVEGKNVVELLRQAIERKKDLAIDVVAVLNDTTGTLMSCAWKKPNAKIGLIIGTGTNACYVEKVANVSKFVGDKSRPYVVINTESGAFGGGGQVDFVRTKWDKDLDADSINPGVNIMEKMISGMYLGEFVRRLLVTAVERQFIFEGVCTEKLKTNGSFDSKFVSDIEGDLPGQHTNARRVLNSLGYGSPTEQDCVDVHYVCFIAWQRAGRMVSAQMAGLLNHMDYKDVTIGVDGSLYRFHPGFADLMNKKIRELTDPSIQFKCVVAEDGSGRGAALLAAVVCRVEKRSARMYHKFPTDVCINPWTSDNLEGGKEVESSNVVERWLSEPRDVELPWMDVPAAYGESQSGESEPLLESFREDMVAIRPTDLELTDEGVVLSKHASRIMAPEQAPPPGRGGVEAESGIVRDIDDSSRPTSKLSSRGSSRRESRGEARREQWTGYSDLQGTLSPRSAHRSQDTIAGTEVSKDKRVDRKGSSNLSSIRSSRIMMKEAVFDHPNIDRMEISSVENARMVPDDESPPTRGDESADRQRRKSVLSSAMTSSRILDDEDRVQNDPNANNLLSTMISEVAYEPNKADEEASTKEEARSSKRRGSRDSQESKRSRRKSDTSRRSSSRRGSREGRQEPPVQMLREDDPGRLAAASKDANREASKGHITEPSAMQSREHASDQSLVPREHASKEPSKEPSKASSRVGAAPVVSNQEKQEGPTGKNILSTMNKDVSYEPYKTYHEAKIKEEAGSPSRRETRDSQESKHSRRRSDASRRSSQKHSREPSLASSVQKRSDEDPSRLDAASKDANRDVYRQDTSRGPSKDPSNVPSKEPSRAQSREASKDASKTSSHVGAAPVVANTEEQKDPRGKNLLSTMIKDVSYEPYKTYQEAPRKEEPRSSSRRGSKEPSQGPSTQMLRKDEPGSKGPSRDPSKAQSRDSSRDASKATKEDPNREPSKDPVKAPVQDASKDPSKASSQVVAAPADANEENQNEPKGKNILSAMITNVLYEPNKEYEEVSRTQDDASTLDASKDARSDPNKVPSEDPSRAQNTEPKKEPNKVSGEEPSEVQNEEPSSDPSKTTKEEPKKDPITVDSSKRPSRDPNKARIKELRRDSSKSPSEDSSKRASKASSEDSSKGTGKARSREHSKDASKASSEEPRRESSKTKSEDSSKDSGKARSREASKDASKASSEEPRRESSKTKSEDSSKGSGKARSREHSKDSHTSSEDLKEEKRENEGKLYSKMGAEGQVGSKVEEKRENGGKLDSKMGAEAQEGSKEQEAGKDEEKDTENKTKSKERRGSADSKSRASKASKESKERKERRGSGASKEKDENREKEEQGKK